MTPQLVHRYSWPIREAIEHLLGDDAGDCGAWRIRIEADELVIDVVAPAIIGSRTRTVDPGTSQDEAGGSAPATAPAAVGAASSTHRSEAAPVDPVRKGGPLARQAGIICGEKGFWTFLAKKFGMTIQSVDEAATCLKALCSVDSRIEFDHDDGKAANFRDIDRSYRLWLDGYDD